MLKRIIFIILIVIMSMTFLNSCSYFVDWRLKMLNSSDDAKKANARLEQVLEAIKNQDREALKTMFSKQALDEAKNIDDGLDYLFELFQGEVESWKNMNGEPSSAGTYEYGKKTRWEISALYYVNTDKEKYFFFIKEYTVDNDNPDNVGMYTLLVMTEEEKRTQWSKLVNDPPGIYMPR